MDDLFFTLTPADVEAGLARRVREARRALRLTQSELAVRSGLSVATVARFEQSGQGQVSSFIRLCAALGRLGDFDGLLKAEVPRSMDELRRRSGADR